MLGHHVRPGERLTVCDLFGADAPEGANRSELATSYASLTRQTFERNYLAFQDELPVITQAPTSVIGERIAPASCRFIHVDASHLYDHVKVDIGHSRRLSQPDGVVVCDDYRSAHTPGVAAAIWGAVLMGGLRPICLTAHKFYRTWGDPADTQEALLAWFDECNLKGVDVQRIAGHRVVRINAWPDPPRPLYRARGAAHVAAPIDGGSGTPDHRPARRRGWQRTSAKELLPPILTRELRSAEARIRR